MLTFRTMNPEELKTVIGWAADEGWNPAVEDAAVFHQTDPEGFFLAELDGEAVAAISVVNHSDSFAFLGLYICRPEHRARGIGLALWNHALLHAGDRVVGLDGVPDQQENYQRSGFVLQGQTMRFEGVLEGKPHADIRAITSADVPDLIAMEGAANGYAKPQFLRAWLCDTAGRKTLVLAGQAGVRGFVTVRECLRGYKVGPLVSNTDQDARILLHAAATLIDGDVTVVDVPDDNAALSDYCRDIGMEISFNTARMYKGVAPMPDTSARTISTLELG